MDIERMANPGALKTKVYVPGKSKREVERELGLSHIIKMASNENARGASNLAQDAYLKLADQLHIYPDAISRDLRQKLARKLGCESDQITVGNGADGVIYDLGMAVVGQEDEVVIPEITFPLYETIVKVMRGRPVYTKMQGFRIDLKAILRAITPKTKVVFLCNPNNPTGDAQPREELLAFLEQVPKDVLVVIDEVYIDFTEPAADPKSVDLFNGGMDNLFILRSFSKIYGLAGIRMGYGIGHADLIALIHRIKPPFNVSIIGEQVALNALDDTKFLKETLAEILKEKAFYYRSLDELGVKYIQSHTNFILIDTGMDATGIFEGLLKLGIITRACKSYGLPTCIRVTIGKHPENLLFLETFKELISRAREAQ
ncbi:MAG: histidinol-phosphate transaminase [Spirochaetota bacterium]